MAEFVAPQFQNPDFLRSAAMGQQMGIQAAMAPGDVQLQQQQVQSGQLNLDMLRQMMGLKSQAAQTYAQTMAGINGTPSGAQSTQTGQQPGGGDGGTQNGPQGSVSGSTYNASDPLAPFLDPRRIAANAAYAQFGAMMSGKDPNEAAAAALKLQSEARDSAVKTKQLQMQGPMNLMDTIATSPDADKIVANNPSLTQEWFKIAPQLGMNPLSDGTPANIRKAAVFAYNGMAGQAGLPPHPMPDEIRNQNLGNGEVGQVSALTGKKLGDLTERQTPSYTLKDVYDPSTNSQRSVPVQTGGYGMTGVNPNAAGNAPPGGGINLGMKAPTDPELKAAMFGSEMRSGMNTLNKMEANGFTLSPGTRTLLINAATSEDEGALKQFGSQVMLKHLSPQEQTYVAALMPVLQAAGHDQSGARLTTSQVRQNIESLLPVDVKNKDALAQVNANRQGFYNGLLTQAGAAAQLPQYKNTLGADLQSAQRSAATAPQAALDHLKAHPELSAQFKAKYGYLPQ